MKIAIVIPARFGSTRLPGKILADLGGKPLLWHVWKRAQSIRGSCGVYVLVDSPLAEKAVKSWGGKAIMTDPGFASGTERIAASLDFIQADALLNIQADEVCFDVLAMEHLMELWRLQQTPIITAAYKISDSEHLMDPNVVKVVIGQAGRALYFSRSAIPFHRDCSQDLWTSKYTYWGHIGVYGYLRDVLERYAKLPHSPLESIEKLEQLRFLEAGIPIQVVPFKKQTLAVDTEKDLQKAREMLINGVL